jgi:hypothetical protein
MRAAVSYCQGFILKGSPDSLDKSDRFLSGGVSQVCDIVIVHPRSGRPDVPSVVSVLSIGYNSPQDERTSTIAAADSRCVES